MEEAFLKFKGTDWMGMTFGLIATHLLAKGHRSGFILGIFSCSAWLAFGVLTASVASVISNLLFIGINCRGFLIWKEKQKDGTLGKD